MASAKGMVLGVSFQLRHRSSLYPLAFCVNWFSLCNAGPIVVIMVTPDRRGSFAYSATDARKVQGDPSP